MKIFKIKILKKITTDKHVLYIFDRTAVRGQLFATR